MKKTKIMAIALTALLVIPSGVYAKENSNNKSANKPSIVSEQKKENIKKLDNNSKQDTSNSQNLKNEAKRDEKKQQIETFKTNMKAKHETMKQIRGETITLKKQIEKKTVQLKTIINDINAGNKTLSEDMLTSLLSKADTLKIDSDGLKSTSSIGKDVTNVQDKVNKKDFTNALSSLDTVIAKLQARLDALKKLNSDLDDALVITNQATTPLATDLTTS
ncbi:MAG: hypothetical protein H7Y18_10805 [Clostridiaceae bacterium]|nr:hypothetical protein [Clostridiaceae bacterium]